MSLESTLERTNELLSQIITILQTGVQAPAELGTPETPASTTKRGPGRPRKDAAAVGIVYWSIPSMNSVFAQEPEMIAPTMPDAVKITKEEYDAKKAEITARVDSVLAAQRQGTTTSASPAPSPAPAPTQPTAGAAGDAAPWSTGNDSGQPAASAATAAQASTAVTDVPFSAVMESAKAVNSSTAPGCGRDGLMAVLKQFLPDDPQPTVTKLQPLGRNTDAKAAFDALLKPAAEFDPLA